jgi:exosome complex exonuclease RRP6
VITEFEVGPECDVQIAFLLSTMAASSPDTRGSPALSPAGFDAFNAKLQASALSAVKASVAALPADVAFHRAVDAEYAAGLDACAARVLALANRLVGLAATADEAGSKVSGKRKGKGRMLEDRDDVVDRFGSVVVDAMDQMLERAVCSAETSLLTNSEDPQDIALDAFLGRSKPPPVAVVPTGAAVAVHKPAKTAGSKGRLDPALQHAAHLAKPQLQFRSPPDNFAEGPWRPTLQHKYHAQVPLGYVVDLGQDEDATTL